MQRSLSGIKHDQFLNTHLYQLPAKLTANTARGTGDQHNFSSEQILYLYRTYPLMKVSIRIRLADSRGNQSLKLITLTIFQKAVFLQTGIFITGKQNTLNTTLTYYIVNIRLIFKVINRKVSQATVTVTLAINIKACDLVMRTVPET